MRRDCKSRRTWGRQTELAEQASLVCSVNFRIINPDIQCVGIANPDEHGRICRLVWLFGRICNPTVLIISIFNAIAAQPPTDHQ